MLCEFTVSAEVVTLACPVASTAAVAMVATPSVNVTLPDDGVPDPDVTVAVKVTDSPYCDGFSEVLSPVAVAGRPTTWMVSVAGLESTVPSFAVKVKLSEPVKPAAGVYVKFGATPVKLPCAGGPATLYVRASPSGSEAVTTIATATPSLVVTV